jgi:hypothetical protein
MYYFFAQCHHMSLMDFMVSPPGCGRSVTEVWGWDAHEAQLCFSDEVDGNIWIWSTGRGLNLSSTKLPEPWSPGNLPLVLKSVVTNSKTSRKLASKFREHIHYIKHNDPQSAYLHNILQNIHDTGTLTDTVSWRIIGPRNGTYELALSDHNKWHVYTCSEYMER